MKRKKENAKRQTGKRVEDRVKTQNRMKTVRKKNRRVK